VSTPGSPQWTARAVVALLTGLLATTPLRAQEGLVLGGGGARGLAHGGVVVGLERLGRDPDIVAGASMGAIIGALYSAGYEPTEIWRIVVDENWPELFTPIPLFVGPDRDARYPVLRVALEGADRGWGLIPDARINRRLTQLLFEAQARTRGDFDRLPRRFRAVAADLATGGLVAPAEGDLARAVRASMAVPGVFAPVAWEGRLLVDGGVRNYLPVTVARELGAESVIAVDVIRPPALEDVDPIATAIRGLRLILLNALPPGSEPDTLILPAITPGFSEALFPRDPRPLLEKGLVATLETLGPAGASPPRARTLPPAPASLGELRIESAEPALERLARDAFRDVVGRPFDAAAVLAAVDRLYATGLFTGVWPAVEPDTGGGAPALRVRLEAEPRVALGGAVGYDNDRGFRGWGALRGRIAAAGRPAELRFEASGDALDRWAALSTRLVPLRGPAWSAGAFARERDVRLFRDDELLDEELHVARLGGWIGAEALRLSPDRAAAATLRVARVDVEGGEEGWAWGPMLRFGETESLARVVGAAPRVEAEASFGAFEHRRARAVGSVDAVVGGAWLAAVADLTLVGGDPTLDELPALGDDGLMPGLRRGRLRGRTRAVAGGDVAFAIPLEALARFRLRAGGVADGVEVPTGSDAWLVGAELGVIWSTAFGPISVAVGGNTRGDWRLDLNLGPIF
jgi:predicted acylesterase/phospholipase RssA